jgi:hypothetical protein
MRCCVPRSGRRQTGLVDLLGWVRASIDYCWEVITGIAVVTQDAMGRMMAVLLKKSVDMVLG